MDIAKKLFFSQQALQRLFLTSNKLQIQGDKYLGDLTIRQMLAIPAIIHAPEGKATINQIARHLGTTKQSAKQIVDALVKKGYLFVAPSEQDKRAVSITITPEGWQAFKSCSEHTDEFLADIFSFFSVEELESFCSLLDKLYYFDGIGRNEVPTHRYNPSEADLMMQHHQNYLKRLTKNHKQEGQ